MFIFQVLTCLFFAFFSTLCTGTIKQLVWVRKRNGWEYALPVQGQASLFSDRSTSKRDALLLAADERVTRSILTIALIEDHNRIVYKKPDFMFRDATPDTDRQLLTKEGQWIFTI